MSKKVLNPTIGSDAEFFLQDKESGEIVSAEGIIQGTKHDPFYFDESEPFFATSLDNVMAEGNIPPATTPLEFYQNVNKLIEYINSTIPGNLQTLAAPSARLDFKYLQTENAMIFGCDPSLNCWTMEESRPEPTGDNVRSAGFHIHIGYDNPDANTNMLLARAMDLYLGVPSILMEPANERKAVGYGLAGNFRNQRHGMEYRSLSSFFSSDKKYIEWCFNQTQEAIALVNTGAIDQIMDMGDLIQNVINKEDRATAKNLVEDFGIKLA